MCQLYKRCQTTVTDDTFTHRLSYRTAGLSQYCGPHPPSGGKTLQLHLTPVTLNKLKASDSSAPPLGHRGGVISAGCNGGWSVSWTLVQSTETAEALKNADAPLVCCTSWST